MRNFHACLRRYMTEYSFFYSYVSIQDAFTFLIYNHLNNLTLFRNYFAVVCFTNYFTLHYFTNDTSHFEFVRTLRILEINYNQLFYRISIIFHYLWPSLQISYCPLYKTLCDFT
jgi:hypothetical protein